MNKIDSVWTDIETKFHYLDKIKNNGSFFISSNDIRLFMEPRLVTKFDTSEDLPQIFKDNKLSILPINRGTYVLSDIKTFSPLQLITSKPEIVSVNGNLTTSSIRSISSESQAINFVLSTGLINEFVGEQQLFPTLDGRQSSESFDFSIERAAGGLLPVKVDKAQVEIDKCLEGAKNIVVIEAKKDRIMPDFMVRQLYYPYRMLQTKSNKPIIPLYFSYNNGILDLRQYEFQDCLFYNSISIVKNKRYYLHDGSFIINKNILLEHLSRTQVVLEPTNIPFPQADTFDRVLSICEKLCQGEFCPSDMTYAIGVTTTRQVLYYGDAACYLGLAESRKVGRTTYYSLSKNGKNILKQLPYERIMSYMLLILSHSIFRETFLIWCNTGNVPDKSTIFNLMKSNSTIQFLDDTVYDRRASTVRSWIKWIVDNLN